MLRRVIPKRIINAWFGRGKKSDLFRYCLDTQRKVSGWDVIEINEDTIDPRVMESKFYKGVLGRGEFVKATEYARLWGLAEYGGVYMDADVELLRPIDHLLDAHFFIGREDDDHLNGAVMGSIQRSVVATALLDCFPLDTDGKESSHFYGPGLLTRELAGLPKGKYGKHLIEHPPDFFYPSHWRTPHKIDLTTNTVAHHRWAKSWVGKY